ncbi:hypothetical protein [Mesorhizobium sp.]|uniref:hypothetical protein n=1 Tax=Mesorhizobium sp. TaxID=1871066 RepID=UPI0025E6AC4E|nr:hypothetical protein [Mesorhizobium sp.]
MAADILLRRIAEKVQFCLVGVQDDAIRVYQMQRYGAVLEKILVVEVLNILAGHFRVLEGDNVRLRQLIHPKPRLTLADRNAARGNSFQNSSQQFSRETRRRRSRQFQELQNADASTVPSFRNYRRFPAKPTQARSSSNDQRLV